MPVSQGSEDTGHSIGKNSLRFKSERVEGPLDAWEWERSGDTVHLATNTAGKLASVQGYVVVAVLVETQHNLKVKPADGRQPERSNRIKDAHDLDLAGLGFGIPFRVLPRFPLGLAVLAYGPGGLGLLDERPVPVATKEALAGPRLLIQSPYLGQVLQLPRLANAHVGYEAGDAAGRVGAPREAEAEDLVSLRVVPCNKRVGFSDVVIETEADGALHKLVQYQRLQHLESAVSEEEENHGK